MAIQRPPTKTHAEKLFSHLDALGHDKEFGRNFFVVDRLSSQPQSNT